MITVMIIFAVASFAPPMLPNATFEMYITSRKKNDDGRNDDDQGDDDDRG